MRSLLFITTLLLSIAPASAQSDFETYARQQRQAFSAYKQQQERDFKQFRDSLNQEFANFLEQSWGSFELETPEPPIKKPIIEPPVFDEKINPVPVPEQIPFVEQPPVVAPPTPVAPPVSLPEPDLKPEPEELTTTTLFFGTNLRLKELDVILPHLSGTGEKEVAQYWRELAQNPYVEIMKEVRRVEEGLNLNNWGTYQLLNHLFKVYVPRGTANEQVVFTIFMLNQFGYRAKIGRNGSELYPMLCFSQEVSNSLFFRYGNDNLRYSVLNPTQKRLPKIQTCRIDYDNTVHSFDLNVEEHPNLSVQAKTKVFHGHENYPLTYNKNLIDFYAGYPCPPFFVYGNADLDKTLQRSIVTQMVPDMEGLTEIDKINFLLNFVQNAFEYKTDNDQFGYEKWFFAEETIDSSYSDCEDRSILFSQLVRRLLGLPVVFVHYPDLHLATAVKLSDSSIAGDYLMVDGEKYLICDPTYINAVAGMSMPMLKNIKTEVIKLK